MLERAASAWRKLAAQRPADARRADEAEKRDARIGGEPLGRSSLSVIKVCHRLGEARLPHQLDELDGSTAASRRPA